MAGHRRGSRPDRQSKPRRPVRQRRYWREQVAAATTSEQLFDVAARWLRAVAAYLPEDQRTQVLNNAGQDLASRADQLARSR